MNTTINPYMFTDASTKNAADLAAWAFNAYESGWGFKSGFIGEKSDEDRMPKYKLGMFRFPARPLC